MNADTIKLILEGLFFPVAIGLVIWAVTQRHTDKAAVKKTLAEAAKIDAEGEVVQETVEAAVALADISTLKESVGLMSTAFREERQSLRERLNAAVKAADTCIERQTELAHLHDDMRADVERYHREVLDMYRRDLYHANAVHILTEWINDVAPILQQLRPDLPRPPHIDPLPPLHINPDEDLPKRRWYDYEPSVDPADQEM